MFSSAHLEQHAFEEMYLELCIIIFELYNSFKCFQHNFGLILNSKVQKYFANSTFGKIFFKTAFTINVGNF